MKLEELKYFIQHLRSDKFTNLDRHDWEVEYTFPPTGTEIYNCKYCNQIHVVIGHNLDNYKPLK